MSTNDFVPIHPMVPADESALEPGLIDDGESVKLDPDVNDELITSAEADRLAAEAADEDTTS